MMTGVASKTHLGHCALKAGNVDGSTMIATVLSAAVRIVGRSARYIRRHSAASSPGLPGPPRGIAAIPHERRLLSREADALQQAGRKAGRGRHRLPRPADRVRSAERERAGGNRNPRPRACTVVARVPIAAEQRALQLQSRVGLWGVDLDCTWPRLSNAIQAEQDVLVRRIAGRQLDSARAVARARCGGRVGGPTQGCISKPARQKPVGST